jgi:hypothetical protein
MLTADQIIDRMLDPVAAAFNEDAARRLAELRFDPELQAHIEHLGDLANEGQLTPEQRADLDLILRIGDVVSVLRVKARAMLTAGAAA